MEELKNLNSYSKQQVKQLAEAVAADYLDGREDALKGYIRAKAYEDYAKHLQEAIKQAAIEEAGKYSKQERHLMGADFQIKETGHSYDYSHDVKWLQLDRQEKKIKALKKKRETLLLLAVDNEIADTETGGILEPPRVKKYGGQTISITFKKE